MAYILPNRRIRIWVKPCVRSRRRHTRVKLYISIVFGQIAVYDQAKAQSMFPSLTKGENQAQYQL